MSRALARFLLFASPLVLLELKRGLPQLLGLGTVAPDPLVVGVAFAALRTGRTRACLFGAAAGFLEDIPTGTPFGLGAARLAFLAGALGAIKTELDAESFLLRPLIVLALALADKVLAALTLEACAPGVSLLHLLLQAVLVAVATALATFFLWPAGDALLVTARPRRRFPARSST